MSKRGVPRVVWERRVSAEQTDCIPLLNLSRSLGDFWSYNARTQKFTVSPCPDVSVVPLDLKEQKFVVIASDGLWNVMTPNEVVSFIWNYEHDLIPLHDQESKDVVRALINEALHRWRSKGQLADNIAVIIAFLSDQPPATTKDVSTSNLQDVTALIMDATSEELQATPPLHLPPEQDAGIIECTSSSQSGNLYYYKQTLPGGTIEYETKIKLHGKKHKPQHHGSKRRRSGEEKDEVEGACAATACQ